MNDSIQILPNNVQNMINIFANHGFSAYVVGGAVRDILLNRPFSDIDLATSATPEEIKKLFPKHFTLGEKYGTITIVYEERSYEVTTFRRDGVYLGHRHPKEVIFGESILEDLSRRDFTINAMAFDGRTVIDPYHGREDVQNGIIRAVGIEEQRFREDALRILRALRFSVVLNFEIEEKTHTAMHQCAHLLEQISGERIKSELQKILQSAYSHRIEEVLALGVLQQLKQKNIIQYADFLPNERFFIYLSNLENPEGAIRLLTLSRYEQRAFVIGEIEASIGEETDKIAIKELLRRYEPDVVSFALKLYEIHHPDISQKRKLLMNLLRDREPYLRHHLAIDGHDLVRLGVTDGKKIGKILEALLHEVICFPEKNKKSELQRAAMKIHKEVEAMKLRDVVNLLNAEVLCGAEHLDREAGNACGSDMMSDVLAYVKDQSVLLTGLVNPQVIRTAEMMDMLCVVFVRGKKPEQSLIDLAASKEIVVMRTELRMYEACGTLYHHHLGNYALE